MTPQVSYEEFLRSKVNYSRSSGFGIEDSEIHPWLMPHARMAVRWAVRGGRRALFESFGLHKTVQQLEIIRLVLTRTGGRRLIVAPLGVRQEFRRDAQTLGIDIQFIRRIEECSETGIYLTNYETVRDGKLDPARFTATSLDEAACLRGMGGTKTFREFMRLFENVKYRFLATATPDPNTFVELLAYADYLGIMPISEAKTRWFKRNATKADDLMIREDAEESFWLWVSSWALFLQSPADLGFSDAGFKLPELRVVYHEVKPRTIVPVADRDGQMRMIADASLGVSEAAREKRVSLDERVAQMSRILAASPEDHFIIWHDLEDERRAIEKEVPGLTAVYGSQDDDVNEQNLVDFADGKIQHLGLKPEMSGSGGNYQKHCHKAIFLGIGFKFNAWIQAIHRLQRFGQQDGNRPLTPEEIANMPISKDFHQKCFGMFHDFYLNHVYNFENHVKIGEALERRGLLPVTFMLLQPPSWHPDIWTDITRMLSANLFQVKKGRQKHICPMQFDLADRVITQMSNPGETVYDPFAGVFTVPSRAIALGRRRYGVELNGSYFTDGVGYCQAEEKKVGAPSLFDALGLDLAMEVA